MDADALRARCGARYIARYGARHAEVLRDLAWMPRSAILAREHVAGVPACRTPLEALSGLLSLPRAHCCDSPVADPHLAPFAALGFAFHDLVPRPVARVLQGDGGVHEDPHGYLGR
jgi:hypothetical protein